MKRYPEETSINAKIFNIIGNICLSNNNYIHFISVYHIQFVKQILHFLEIASNEDTYSEITLNMAVRFLRILMHFPGNPSFIRDVVGAVWCLFEKVVAEWKKTGRKQKLLKNIIKLVEDISEQKEYYLDMVKETSLECLSQVALLSPKRIVDIFQSFLFARSSMMKDPRKLPIRETFDAFRNLLLSSSAKELGRDYIVYIECICSMMVHPFERDIERSRSCVKLLIKTLESFNNPSKQEMMCWITILETFMVHKNVTAFVNDLMDCNIIHILTDTLRRALGIPNNPKLQLVDMYTVQCYLRTRMIPREDELLYISDDEYHTSDDEPHFSDDEPHFSDDECRFSCKHNRFCHSNYQCDMLSTVSPDGNIIKYPLDEYLSQLFEPETDSTGRRTDIKFQISEVRRLLIVRTTQMVVICRRIQPTHPQFGSKEFLLRMIQGAMFLPYHSSEEKKIVEVIIEILKCPTFLVSLMQTDIIEQIYDLSLYESRKLDDLKQPSGYEYEIWAEKLLQCFFCTANSAFGNGCTKKALMEGDDTVKALIVNVIPYTQ
ncbi:uncharacterized protein [Leptinotarsa decemlineata]|uniref:uncharacterized protein n=1 Tax=Leptinotarsa decemlineata TaxID=7539 RepID=UPI003D304C99